MAGGGSLPATSAKVALKPKTLFHRNDASKPVFNGVSYHAALTLQSKTLDVVVDTFWEDTWFSCRVVSGLGCDTACPKKKNGEDFDPYGCFTEANATFQLGNATFTDTVVGFAIGKVANGMSRHQGSIGVDGVIGLGYLESFITADVAASFLSKSKPMNRMVDSFSVSLASDAEFLMLNGVDEAFIAERKLTARPMAMRAREIRMTAFQVEGLTANGPALYPCDRSAHFTTDDVVGCRTDITSATSILSMPRWIFDAFETKYLAASAGTGCSKTVDTGEELVGKNRLYACPSTVVLPRLGLTFGNTTLYLDSTDYTMPMPDDASKVIVNMIYDSIDFSLGAAFTKKFYLAYVPEESLTVYCKDGDDCKFDAVTNPPEPSKRWKNKDYDEYARTYFGNPVNATDSSKKSGGSSGASQDDPMLSGIKAAETSSKVIWVVAIVIGLIISAVSAYKVRSHNNKKAAEAAASADAKPADEDADPATPSASTPSSSVHLHEAVNTPTAAAAAIKQA